MIEELLRHGAQLEARDDADMTPLLFAAANFLSTEAIRAVASAGADLHALGEGGRNALEIARSRDSDPADEVHLVTRPTDAGLTKAAPSMQRWQAGWRLPKSVGHYVDPRGAHGRAL